MSLDEMQARCDAATPGPWVQQCTPPGPHGQMIYRNAVLCAEYPNHAICKRTTPADDGYDRRRSFDNMVFIAHARTDMPRLIAALRVAMAGLNGLAALGGGRSEGNCDAQRALARVTAILEGK